MEKQLVPSDNILIDGVYQLIDLVETPSVFLDYIADAMGFVHREKMSNGRFKRFPDPHYRLQMIITHVIKPWFEGADDMIAKMADGLLEIHDCIDSYGFQQELITVLLAITKEMQENGWPLDDVDQRGIRALILIGLTIEEYEKAWIEELDYECRMIWKKKRNSQQKAA